MVRGTGIGTRTGGGWRWRWILSTEGGEGDSVRKLGYKSKVGGQDSNKNEEKDWDKDKDEDKCKEEKYWEKTDKSRCQHYDMLPKFLRWRSHILLRIRDFEYFNGEKHCAWYITARYIVSALYCFTVAFPLYVRSTYTQAASIFTCFISNIIDGYVCQCAYGIWKVREVIGSGSSKNGKSHHRLVYRIIKEYFVRYDTRSY